MNVQETVMSVKTVAGISTCRHLSSPAQRDISSLRRNEYKIEYNVRNFNLDEARRMVDERPDLLSLTEMYKVADSYEKGSPGYGKVMQVAARYSPMHRPS